MSDDNNSPRSQGTKAGLKKPSAGQCEKCGFYKTWQYKILNPASGKYMPAHINSSSPDQEGDVLGEGDCPKVVKATSSPAAAPSARADAPPHHAAPVARGEFITAEQMFNTTPEAKSLIQCIRVAIREDLSEILAVLREIRDGKNRSRLHDDVAGMAEGDLPARSRS